VVVQAAGYGGYRTLAKRGDVSAGPRSLSRFYEPAAAGPAPIASEALERSAASNNTLKICGKYSLYVPS
jgi:transposase